MVSCPNEFGKGVLLSKIWSQLRKLTGNSDVHQHVVPYNSISFLKEDDIYRNTLIDIFMVFQSYYYLHLSNTNTDSNRDWQSLLVHSCLFLLPAFGRIHLDQYMQRLQPAPWTAHKSRLVKCLLIEIYSSELFYMALNWN